MKFVDLPNEIRLDEVAEHFGADTAIEGGGILVCGSPGETANDPSLGQVFEVIHGRDTDGRPWRQREYTWLHVALTAPDQLRQRVAWAFAQLLVVAIGAIRVQEDHSEGDFPLLRRTSSLFLLLVLTKRSASAFSFLVFLTYYDIFVRHGE